MKKRRLQLWIVLGLVAVFFVGTTAVLNYKADWRYVAGDWATHLFTRAELQPAPEQELLEFTLEELLADPRTKVDQSMLLINGANPLPADFVPDVEPYWDTDTTMNSCVIHPYQNLSTYVRENYGERLFITSSFRTAAEQQVIAMENSEEIAAAVGESEHQAGLALDVCVSGYGGNAFIKSPVGQYVNDEAWRYGFIIRYPYYGTQQTGITYEPWHLRYVGAPHAEVMTKNRWTLEEYFDALHEDVYYACGDYQVSRQSGDSFLVPADYASLTLSPDNQNKWIISVFFGENG